MADPGDDSVRERPPTGSFEETRLHQIERGLALSMAERLEWLEDVVEGLRPLLGAAREERRGSSGDPPRSAPS